MPTIYDNQVTRLSSGLEKSLYNEVSVDICVGYFNIRGWSLLRESVRSLQPSEGAPAARLLVGMLSRPDLELREELRDAALQAKGVAIAVDGKRMKLELNRLLEDFQTQLVVGIPSKKDLVTLVDLRDSLRSRRVVLKAFLGGRLHAKLYVAHRRDLAAPRVAFVGSSNLTQSGLERQGELTIDVLERHETDQLAGWFSDRWDDLNAMDISQEVADLIDNSWIDKPHPIWCT